jgi:hypothetical protein
MKFEAVSFAALPILSCGATTRASYIAPPDARATPVPGRTYSAHVFISASRTTAAPSSAACTLTENAALASTLPVQSI